MKLYKNGIYLLDDAPVKVTTFTEQFVIVEPEAGGAQVVVDRPTFEQRACLARRWYNRAVYLHGRVNSDGALWTSGVTHPTPSPFATTAGSAPYDWVIDLSLIPDEAWVVDPTRKSVDQ